MRTRNPSTGRAEGIVRGHTGTLRAGTAGPTVHDSQGGDVTAPDIQFVGAVVSGEDGDTAYVTITGTGQQVTNDSGDAVIFGEVVVRQTDGSVTTTTTAADTRQVGVVQGGAFDGQPVPVVFQGDVAQVNTTGTVNQGDYLETSATAGLAQSAGTTPGTGSFGQALAAGPNPPAVLFGSTYIAPSAASGAFLTALGGEKPTVSTTAASGTTLTLDLSTANLFDVTLTGSCTLTFSNPPAAAGEWTIVLRQDATGSRTVTWPAAVKWQSATGTNAGSAPTLFTAATAEDIITITTLDGGTTYGGGSERAASSSVSALDELSDVQTSGEVAGAMLVYDGAVWRPGAPAEPLILEDGTIAILENGHAAMAEPTYL